ncbi:MAG: alkene reductase [Fimbriimonadaceae bacterium]|nr:alkene reductase [Chthonomonadaceae bacterium]MCO5295770.1 alkene reductase [Fimbriimonadaceae bacterium]
MNTLFQPLLVGGLELPNRLAMAPMTRSRANADGTQTPMAVEYYRQRADAGLLITEAVAVSHEGRGYPNIPGLWMPEHETVWREVARAVHASGGRVFMQLFHTGRIGHSSLLPGLPQGPSAVAPEGKVMDASFAMRPYETPAAMDAAAIRNAVDAFRIAAGRAVALGMDGVELHAANGYLIDQFLRDGANRRDDGYGGSIVKRMRFLVEVVEAVRTEIGSDRIGVRISPWSGFNSMADSDPDALFQQVARKLDLMGIAYLHLIEKGEWNEERTEATDMIRTAFSGPLMANSGYTPQRAIEAIREGRADLVSFGVPYLANPDLVFRVLHGEALNPANSSTFYGGGAEGYLDYPILEPARR